MSAVRRRRRTAMALTAAITALGAWPLTQAVAGPAAPPVPDRIVVDDANKLFLVAHAVGVQIYPCNATADGFAWGATTPRANLYDDGGKLVVTHFGGPTWQARDGSAFVGQRIDGVTVDPSAIPWLLLKRASSSVGQDGDRLTGTTFIQRINTAGGLPPAATECNAATAGTKREVAYTDDYAFWKAKDA